MNDAKLNELAATEVMGWKDQGEFWHIDDETLRDKEDWNPRTDWNDMRLVMESGGFQRLVKRPNDYYAEFLSDGEKIELFGASDPEAGRAVCLAALKAKGVEVG